jgi:hypothetical protein
MSPLARRTNARPAGTEGGRGVAGHNVGTFLQRARSGRGCSARASAGDRAVATQGGLASLMPPPGIIAALSTPAVGTRSSWASVSESDDGTRLSFPSIDPGREVFQPNAVVGLCHRLASLPARRLCGPCPADRWSSRAPIPPCSSRPFLPMLHVNAALLMTTRVAFVAYPSSLTGMRRHAFADARHALMANLTERRRRCDGRGGGD